MAQDQILIELRNKWELEKQSLNMYTLRLAAVQKAHNENVSEDLLEEKNVLVVNDFVELKNLEDGSEILNWD